MEFLRITNPAIPLLLIATFLGVLAGFHSTPLPQSAPHIGVIGSLSANRTRPGRTVQVSIVMDIPAGYHVNSSKPLEKFLIPTSLKTEVPEGIRVGPINYPRAVLRSFKFSKNRVSVYEGRATTRFRITVPKSFNSGSAEVKVRLRYQSCNDEVCFPPQTREVSLWLNID